MSLSGLLSSDARQIAWKNFVRTGDPHFLQGLPQRVAESWQRCWQHGVDPGLRSVPEDTEWQLSQDVQAQQLVRLALPILASWKEDLAATAFFLFLVNASGRIIHREGNAEILRSVDKYNVLPGALVTENLVGTNGIGTALLLKEPMPVDRYEHFCENFCEWADIGVPFFHPVSQECVGALGLSFQQKSLTPAEMLLARTIAGNIQSRLLAREQTLHALLLEQFVQRTQKYTSPLLAVDRNGIILAATSSFAQWLNVTPDKLHGRALSFLPQVSQITQEAMIRNEAREAVLSWPHTDRLSKVSIEPLRQNEETAGALLFLSLPPTAIRSIPRPTSEIGRWAARYTFADLMGEDPRFQDALRLAQRVASTDLPVLIQGETGTGKELLAHAIHNASPRRRGPFVAVNCGAIPQDLIASELFGYEKGAFTGAASSGKRGKFSLASGGTIFLDEIGETSPVLQVSLLRALQDHEIIPVGSEQPRRIDVRVLAASNRNLQQLVRQATFRSDLYYRLNGVSITLPALKERPDDIALLAHHFLKEAGQEKTIAPETLALLQDYPWPGNIRELCTALQAAAVITEGPIIQESDLPADLRRTLAVAQPPPEAQPSIFQLAVGLKQLELQVLIDAIQLTRGNLKQAAKELGIARSSLYRKLHEFGLGHAAPQSVL